MIELQLSSQAGHASLPPLPSLNGTAQAVGVALATYLSGFKGCLALESTPFPSDPPIRYRLAGVTFPAGGRTLHCNLEVLSAGKSILSLTPDLVLDGAWTESFPITASLAIERDRATGSVKLTHIARHLQFTNRPTWSFVTDAFWQVPLKDPLTPTALELYARLTQLPERLLKLPGESQPFTGEMSSTQLEQRLRAGGSRHWTLSPGTFVSLLSEAVAARAVEAHRDQSGALRYSLTGR